MDKETLHEWIGGFAFLQEIIGRKEYEVCEAVLNDLGTAREALSRASRTIDRYLKDNK